MKAILKGIVIGLVFASGYYLGVTRARPHWGVYEDTDTTVYRIKMPKLKDQTLCAAAVDYSFVNSSGYVWLYCKNGGEML